MRKSFEMKESKEQKKIDSSRRARSFSYHYGTSSMSTSDASQSINLSSPKNTSSILATLQFQEESSPGSAPVADSMLSPDDFTQDAYIFNASPFSPNRSNHHQRGRSSSMSSGSPSNFATPMPLRAAALPGHRSFVRSRSSSFSSNWSCLASDGIHKTRVNYFREEGIDRVEITEEDDKPGQSFHTAIMAAKKDSDNKNMLSVSPSTVSDMVINARSSFFSDSLDILKSVPRDFNLSGEFRPSEYCYEVEGCKTIIRGNIFLALVDLQKRIPGLGITIPSMNRSTRSSSVSSGTDEESPSSMASSPTSSLKRSTVELDSIIDSLTIGGYPAALKRVKSESSPTSSTFIASSSTSTPRPNG